jgi:hypothetical protein
MMTDTTEITLENFTEATGSRFRVTKEQAARIAVSALSDDERVALASMSVDEAAASLNATNKDGKPLRWVEVAVTLAGNWNNDQTLTRTGAFEEFVSSGGLENIRSTRKPIPLSVFQASDLTISNFGERVEAAVGYRGRFRLTNEQSARIQAGELTKEDAFTEFVQRRIEELTNE